MTGEDERALREPPVSAAADSDEPGRARRMAAATATVSAMKTNAASPRT